jgi:uncharacterized protein (DUF2267 family)
MSPKNTREHDNSSEKKDLDSMSKEKIKSIAKKGGQQNTIGHVFDPQLQKTYDYLKNIMQEGQITSPHRAYSILRAVLHTLRDCLTIEEIAHLGAQLPMIIRGIYYENWDPNIVPKKIKTLEDFFYNVCLETSNAISIQEAEKNTPIILLVLTTYISEGEIQKIKNMLPKHLKNIL